MEVYYFKAIFDDGTEWEFYELTQKNIRKAKRMAKRNKTTLIYILEGNETGPLYLWHTRQAYDQDGNRSDGLSIAAMATEAIQRPYDLVGVALGLFILRRISPAVEQSICPGCASGSKHP